MGTSPNRSYPYPAGSDPVDVPGDMEALADAVDTDMAAVIAGTGLADGAVTTAKIADGAVTLAKSSGVANPFIHGALGSRYISIGAAARSTAIPGEGQLRLFPVALRAGTLTRIGASVTVAGAAGAVVRLGIYASAATGGVGSLLLDAGTIDGTSATVQEITISQAVAEGVYWLGAVVQGGAASRPTMVTCGDFVNIPAPVVDSSLATFFATPRTLMPQEVSVTGALPATIAPVYNATGANTPLLAVRY